MTTKFRHILTALVSILLLARQSNGVNSQQLQTNSNKPAARLYGHINLPTDFLGMVPARSVMSGINDGRNQPLAAANFLNPNYYSRNEHAGTQSSQVQDLISQLSAALLSSLNNAVIPYQPQSYQPQPPQTNNGLGARTNSRYRDFPPAMYPQYQPQNYAPISAPSYASYGNNAFQGYPYDTGYSPNFYSAPSYPLPPQFGGSNLPPSGSYGYGMPQLSQYQRPPSPMSRSENQFGYGVNAGVYAGTYGGSSASATPDGGPPLSYGGLSPWTIINGGPGNVGNSSTLPSSSGSNGAKRPAGNGNVVPIPISEAISGSSLTPASQGNTDAGSTNAP